VFPRWGLTGDYKTKYFAEAKNFIKDAPRSLVEAKAEKIRSATDPSPLTINRDRDGMMHAFFPDAIPEDVKPKVLPVISMLLAMAEWSNMQVEVTKQEGSPSFWNTLVTAADNVTGAFYCLTPGKNLGPMDNIPAAHKRGWEFATWYGFAAAAKVTDYSEYYSIPRVTSIFNAEKGKWGSDKIMFPDIDRLNTFIRICAAEKARKNEIAPVRTFIKGLGFFLGKLLGKKPVPGVYLSEEIQALTEDWSSRKCVIEKKFSMIKRDFKDYQLDETLTRSLTWLTTTVSDLAKRIEEYAQKRIPELLITEGRGKTQRKTIVKGSNLPEKLKNINGGDSVRTIAKVMWTPMCDLTLARFCDAVMSVAKQRNNRKDSILESYNDLIQEGHTLSFEQEAILSAEHWIQEAVEIYLEVIPDKSGQVAWDSCFGTSK
jgi:hypothetical protein